jgi:hypothetical protein
MDLPRLLDLTHNRRILVLKPEPKMIQGFLPEQIYTLGHPRHTTSDFGLNESPLLLV